MRLLLGIICFITIINSINTNIAMADQPMTQPLPMQNTIQNNATQPQSATNTTSQTQTTQGVQQPQQTIPQQNQIQKSQSVPVSTPPQTLPLSKRQQIENSLVNIKQSIKGNPQFLTYKDLIKRSLKGILVGVGAFIIFILALSFIRNKSGNNTHQAEHKQSFANLETPELNISEAVISYIKHKL